MAAVSARTKISAHIAPSLLASDFANLASESRKVIDGGADWLHFDVMDGHFVPNLVLGAPIVQSLRRHIPPSMAFFDCHLMVASPEKWVDDFAKAGADQFTFHAEATDDPGSLIDQIHAAGMKAGMAVKPGTDVDVIFPYADKLNLALVMTVEPGFGGQKFMADMMPKVRNLRDRYPSLNIQVDGGVGPGNIDVVSDAGANVIVAGSSVFKADDPVDAIGAMRCSVEKALEKSQGEAN